MVGPLVVDLANPSFLFPLAVGLELRRSRETDSTHFDVVAIVVDERLLQDTGW